MAKLSTLTYRSSATAPTMAWRNPPTWPIAALCTSCTVSQNICHRTERQYHRHLYRPNGYIFPWKILFLRRCRRQNSSSHLCGTKCVV